MKSFMYRWPGSVYANGPVRAKNEAEARAYVRRLYKCDRLPNGFEIWEGTGRL